MPPKSSKRSLPRRIRAATGAGMPPRPKGADGSTTKMIAAQRRGKQLASSNTAILLRENRGDFIALVEEYRSAMPDPKPFTQAGGSHGITVVARKRPMFRHELENGDFDAVSVSNPLIVVHKGKKKFDGAKVFDNVEAPVDIAFRADVDEETVYQAVARGTGAIRTLLSGGTASIIAFGQTSSGKTHTITNLEERIARDIFSLIDSEITIPVHVECSFFELDGDRLYDLLNDRTEVFAREDEDGEVLVRGLSACIVTNSEELLQVINVGASFRRTTSTNRNDESSRTHAFCRITIKTTDVNGIEHIAGEIELVDLAGSERAADTIFHDETMIAEAAKINQSLMTFKESVRIRATKGLRARIPYRGSRLTMLLKKCFVREQHRTVVIGCLSPSCSDMGQSVDTLRFIGRIRESQRQEAADEFARFDIRTWSKPKIRDWIRDLLEKQHPSIGAKLILETQRAFKMNGPMFTRLTEAEFINRIENERIGKLLYQSMKDEISGYKAMVRQQRRGSTASSSGETSRPSSRSSGIVLHQVPFDFSSSEAWLELPKIIEFAPTEQPTNEQAYTKQCKIAVRDFFQTRSWPLSFRIQDDTIPTLAHSVYAGHMCLAVTPHNLTFVCSQAAHMPYLQLPGLTVYSSIPVSESGRLLIGHPDSALAKSGLILIVQE